MSVTLYFRWYCFLRLEREHAFKTLIGNLNASVSSTKSENGPVRWPCQVTGRGWVDHLQVRRASLQEERERRRSWQHLHGMIGVSTLANLRMFCEAYVCRSVWISITHISHKYVEDRAYYIQINPWSDSKENIKYCRISNCVKASVLTVLAAYSM